MTEKMTEMTEEMTDKSIMPFGRYKGKHLINVPDRYLYHLYETNKAEGSLKEYIEKNLDGILMNIENGTEC